MTHLPLNDLKKPSFLQFVDHAFVDQLLRIQIRFGPGKFQSHKIPRSANTLTIDARRKRKLSGDILVGVFQYFYILLPEVFSVHFDPDLFGLHEGINRFAVTLYELLHQVASFL